MGNGILPVQVTESFVNVYTLLLYTWITKIKEAAKRIGEERGIPVEVKKIGNSYYLYRDTTRWDRKKKRVRISEYMGKINENGLVERNHRSIYEFGNSELLLSISEELIPELKRHFPDHWKEIMAMVRAQDPRPIRYMKSAWEKMYASAQMDASLSENTVSEKLRIIGSDVVAQMRFSQSLATSGDRVYERLSSVSYTSKLRKSSIVGDGPPQIRKWIAKMRLKKLMDRLNRTTKTTGLAS
ncbi:MAG: hypothetical protein B2I17_03630 [Thermoplasmatales archaeon B_DKE]|nr:MAG: hypothetical protein B2I17_03630 [Thermoplasmatales archaeon B_DKE]